MKIGIIGAGFFGEKHAHAIRDVSELELVAASRTNSAALQEFCKRFEIRGYGDYRDLLQDAGIDAVVIATPHYQHAQIAVDTLRSGKHVLLEKPMAPTLQECDTILEAASDSSAQIMVGHISLYSRAYRTAKQLIQSSELGEVVLGVSTMSKQWMEPNRREWHLNRETGGGMWLTAGMHCLDRLTWLIEGSVRSVDAAFQTRFHDQEADDVGMVFLRYSTGAVGTVVSTGYHIGAPKNLTELTCTKGSLNIDYSGGVVLGRDDVWTTVENSASSNWMHEALVEEWRAFHQAVVSNSKPEASAEYGRHIMEVVFSAEQSAKEQREISIQDASR